MGKEAFFLQNIPLNMFFLQDDFIALMPSFLQTHESKERLGFCLIRDPVLLWQRFSKFYPIADNLCKDIEGEIESSFLWQSS
jgi:hypothetical protein